MLKELFIFVGIENPAVLGLHYVFYRLADAALATGELGHYIADSLNLRNCIGRAYGKAAKLQGIDVRDIVADEHNLLRANIMAFAEVQKVIGLHTGLKVNIGIIDSAGREACGYGFGAASGDDCHGVAVHCGHADGKAVLGVEGSVQLSLEIAEHAAVGEYAVDVECEGLNLFEIRHKYMAANCLGLGPLDGTEVSEVDGVALGGGVGLDDTEAGLVLDYVVLQGVKQPFCVLGSH